MKKILSVALLFTMLGLTTPVLAAPGGPGGHGGSPGPGGHMGPPPHHQMHSPAPRGGHYGAPLPPPRHYYGGGRIIVGGALARRSCGYYPFFDYRLGWNDYCYAPYYSYPGNSMYINFGVPIRF